MNNDIDMQASPPQSLIYATRESAAAGRAPVRGEKTVPTFLTIYTLILIGLIAMCFMHLGPNRGSAAQTKDLSDFIVPWFSGIGAGTCVLFAIIGFVRAMTCFSRRRAESGLLNVLSAVILLCYAVASGAVALFYTTLGNLPV
ncbi:MAG: hypothetical protein H6818_19410 [Phycisphaerales bacterium]|nr:hypothetical protein [Phycisphaerales bacterium]MCB9863634.1 hypothetical protein [Phycisphaerales bacterium]